MKHRAIDHAPVRLAGTICLAVLIAAASLITPTRALAQGGGTHTVQAGENLFRIALRYNMTVGDLAVANGIVDPTRIYAGQVLNIPVPGSVIAPAEPNYPPALPAEPYYPPALPAESAPVAPPPAAPATGVYHTVQRGETLASIAQAYGVTWPGLVAANGIVNANRIFAGQQILIPGATAPVAVSPAPAPAYPAPAATGSQGTHIVQPGEHLAVIAQRYGLTWTAVAQANNLLDPNRIYSGQSLIIPAGGTAGGSYAPPAASAPPPTIHSGKQIVVDLSSQMTYAYENGTLLRASLSSTGLPPTPTVQGDFAVYRKHVAAPMSGPGYYLPDVPYVMYFYQSYGLHGTYWHSNFGQPMSHGCVNLPTPEAEWFFNWAEVGTPVHVQW